MEENYRPEVIEAKWQKTWQESGIYETDLAHAKNPYYNLMMFPYPSAEGLHVGNVYAFTGADIHGRFRSMQGKDVFEPMGFDAFGIHSENFAIKKGVHPKVLIAQNVAHFRQQLRRLGGRFAWSKEVETTDPDYYRWTQWIFVQLMKAGLAYRKKAPVNWCPSCRTVLANEQVIHGLCERCDSQVEPRELEQWFFAITRYADRLLDNLDDLDWSDVIKVAQRGWIGRSEGAELSFAVDGHPGENITVFTTRPDTLFGATFLVVSPEHPLVDAIVSPGQRDEVEAYVRTAKTRGNEERTDPGNKTGVFTGAFAKNPFSEKPVPIWVADYVLAHYGTGAVMGVPGHDERDFVFASTHGLPIVRVVAPEGWQGEPLHEAYTGPGTLVNSGTFTGLPVDEAKTAIIARAAAIGVGAGKRTYHLRDWLISRQRYWGPPIPVIYCDACGAHPVPEEDLPVRLPDVEDFVPKGTGKSPLASMEAFVKATCPECGAPARRETDVSDNFLDSSWYFLRYPSARDQKAPFDAALTQKWLPVDMYIGGKEHAVLHLLYTRFICMALKDMGFLAFEEPFKHFRAHGIIASNGAKMSKSRGNVVNPDFFFDRYGADTFRAYLMFMGPYQEGGDFSDQGIEGLWRFLNRLHQLIHNRRSSLARETEPDAEKRRHRLIKKVSEDLEGLKYNTAIAAMMEYLNGLPRQETLSRAEAKTIIALLAPLCPHITEELWEGIGETTSVHLSPWPAYDREMVQEDEVTIIVQVNGRVRDRIQLQVGASETVVRELALQSDVIRRHVALDAISKTVFVPDKLLNIVVTE